MTLLQEYAARSASRDAGSTAVVLGEERLTYGGLVSESRRLGRLLQAAGVDRGDRVALLVPKSPAAIAAVHAVLEASASYVPIDLASPPKRAAMVIESAQPRVVLASASATRLIDALSAEGTLDGISLISTDPSWAGNERRADYGPPDWAGLADDPLEVADDPGQIAHILFTSGSTGVPKGVPITHAMVRAFVDWAVEHFETAAGERISGHPPLHFDLSTFDIYATLKAGAELHLVPLAVNMVPGALAGFIRESALHQWFSVPSTLAFMVRSGVVEQGDFPTLRRVLFCGEAMPAAVLGDWMRRVPHARYTNLYGPTEATIASSFYDVPSAPATETESVPIGTPCPGEELLVLDGTGGSVRDGDTGDIHIGGVGLSPGYWNDREKTQAAFIPDPRAPSPQSGAAPRIYRTGDLGRVDERGLYRYVGRADSQIKHRGYRIELGEIEAALDALGEVRECAVVAVETEGFEATAICCAYVAQHEAVAPSSLRVGLSASLPAYMLPTRWAPLDSLPKNANGKIDRRELSERFELELAEAD